MTEQIRKRISKIYVASIAAIIFTLLMASNALLYAAEQGAVKTATLNNANVSFNGKEPVTIQTYMIDGSNFVRARDITNALNMELQPIQNSNIGVGIVIVPYENAKDITSLEVLTADNISVEIIDGLISYHGKYTDAKCFNYNGRYYFKLSDFAAASKNSYDVKLEVLEIQAKSGINGEPGLKEFIGINVDWDSDKGIININKTKHDFVTQLHEIRRNTVVAPNISVPSNVENSNTEVISKTPNAESEQVSNIITQPPLSAPPVVGEILANILVDENKSAYLDNEMINVNYENINYAYKPEEIKPVFGQCTWYAIGRLTETMGVEAGSNEFWTGGLDNWISNIAERNCPDVIGSTDPYSISERSIAVWKTHVAFVEYIEYDSNYTPTYVYFSEANTGHDGIYRHNKDGKIQKIEFSKFINRSGKLLGYITAK